MRLPSKKRLVEILQHGDVDPEWKYVEEELVHQWDIPRAPTKISVYIAFYFRNREDGRGVTLSQRHVVQLPSSWFRVEKWEEWLEGI